MADIDDNMKILIGKLDKIMLLLTTRLPKNVMIEGSSCMGHPNTLAVHHAGICSICGRPAPNRSARGTHG